MRASAPMGHLLPPLIREAYPRHAAKRAARATGAPLETARNWVRGRAAPSAETLLRWADACDAFAAALEGRLHARHDASAAGPAGAVDGPAAAPGGSTLSDAGRVSWATPAA